MAFLEFAKHYLFSEGKMRILFDNYLFLEMSPFCDHAISPKTTKIWAFAETW